MQPVSLELKENLLLNNVDNTGCIKTYKYSYIRCLVVKRRSVKQELQMYGILSNSDEKYPSEPQKRILMLL
jgi:hypothetical protein